MSPEERFAPFIPKLEKALAYFGSHDILDVVEQLESKHAQLWTRGDGLIVTQVEDKPKCRVLRFWLAAGKLEDVLEIAVELYAWGHAQGCDRAEFVGRKGWKPVLEAHGWVHRDDIYVYQREL